jgi:MFS family permease
VTEAASGTGSERHDAPEDTLAVGVYDRSVVAMLVSIFTSSVAAMAAETALGKQVYDLTHSDLDLGLLGLAEFAPAALLVLLSGSLADRYDRRLICGLSLGVMTGMGAVLAWYAGQQAGDVLPIFGFVVLFGAARAVMNPAQRALVPDLVPPETLPWLIVRRTVTWQVAIISGPVLAGFLYAVDPAAPYIAMAALLGVGALALLFVKPLPRTRAYVAPRAGLHEAFEGLRFIRRSPVLLGAISLDLFAVLFGGAVALLPALAEDQLHVGAVGLGWLRAAGGIGATAVTLYLTRRPVVRHVGRSLLVAVAVFGLGTIVLGATSSFVIAFVALMVLSGADSISVFIRSSLVPLVTPADKRGRVLAVEAVFIGASNELGGFESGVAGEFLGSSVAVVLGGAATLVVAGTYFAFFAPLRDIDRFPASVDMDDEMLEPTTPPVAPP